MTCPLAVVASHTCGDPTVCLRAVIAALTNQRPRDERRRGT